MAVKVGEEVFEVHNNRTYFYNDEINPDLNDAELSGHKLIHKQASKPNVERHSFTVLLIGDDFDLKDSVALEITQTRRQLENNKVRESLSFQILGINQYRRKRGKAFSDCQGLAGSWNHARNGAFLSGRSGKTYTKEEGGEFGPEWQVDSTKGDPMLFMEKVGPQLPDQKCDNSPLQAKDQRHLKALLAADGGALARQAEEACSHVNDKELFDACFFDVLVTGDVTFAQESWYTGDE